ncbi:MAG: flavin reductase [Ekhidna sp.]|nr:flavin reductase [Ekhidna sp.]
MQLTKEDIQNMERRKRLNIINSITGIKPANLIGSVSNEGRTNIAIFSSVVHLGSDPALLGFITRPTGKVPRHTYENLKETGFYTINQVPAGIIKNAHYTSAKLDRKVSEFKRMNLKEEYLSNFKAPFLKESRLKIGMKFEQEIPIALNGTILIIGTVELLQIDDEAINEKGYIDLQKLDAAGISGLNSYYSLTFLESFPYVRESKIPDFGT